MTIFLILTLLIIIAISYYLMPSIKNRLILFTCLIILTPIGYILKGSFESFTFNEENNKIIEDIIISKENIDELDPNRLILYLESKLNKNPKDLQGWLILARTCSLSGYLQKADLYFKKGLNFFPYDEDLLFEYSLLKKNTNQFKSALEILSKLKVISPTNIFARELIIDILITINNKQLAQKEWNEMVKSKNFDNNKLLEIRDKFEL
ncbi:MAG: tetratricopeptide repeat protein [Alphaproteobacteria bacterium]